MRIATNEPSTSAFFQAQKEIWKEHFQPIEIWITAYEIEII
jgi:hypothetical protein